MEEYIFLPAARRKLKAAQDILHTAYIFGATDYGKTELARQHSGLSHLLVPCYSLLVVAILFS